MSLLAAIPTKAAVGLAAATIATSGVAIKTAATGSPNPLVWGQQVEQKVQDCKKDLGAGQHGIGQCVSVFARQHGQEERAAHANANSSQAPQGKGKPAGVGRPVGAGSPPSTPGAHGKP